MVYPHELAPKLIYKKFLSWSLVERNFALIRHTSRKQITLGNSNKIDPEMVCSPQMNMNDLSFNLCGLFKEKHIPIKVKKEAAARYNREWNEFNRGLVPTMNEIEIDNNRGCFYVQFDNLHGKQIPSEVTNGQEFKLTCQLVHKPIKCNFWHIQLQWLTETNNIVSREDAIWKRPVHTATRAMVTHFAKPNLSNIDSPKWFEYCLFIPSSISNLLNQLIPKYSQS